MFWIAYHRTSNNGHEGHSLKELQTLCAGPTNELSDPRSSLIFHNKSPSGGEYYLVFTLSVRQAKRLLQMIVRSVSDFEKLYLNLLQPAELVLNFTSLQLDQRVIKLLHNRPNRVPVPIYDMPL